jgi:hypothetical protein
MADSDAFIGSLRDRMTIVDGITEIPDDADVWETETEWVELCRENPPK